MNVLFFVGCNKNDNNAPECIQEKITTIKAEKVRNPPSKVYQYQYNGKIVYYIPSYCCDVMGELYDDNCNLLCYPDGGILGNGDGKCNDFFTKRSNEKIVWEDVRK